VAANDNDCRDEHGRSEARDELALLRDTSLVGLRRSILVQLRAGAKSCREGGTEPPYEARERFAHLCQVARSVEKLASAGIIMLREPLG
jgi:hypothetical protein